MSEQSVIPSASRGIPLLKLKGNRIAILRLRFRFAQNDR